MRAIVLAAGEGSRLRPLTATRPKPMVEAANRPILAYALDALVQNGIQDVTLVVGYHRERIQAYFEDGRRFGARISYVFQSALLGTAHALSLCDLPKEDYVVLGGDNVVDADIIREVIAAKGETVLAAKRSENPSKYGVLTLEGPIVRRIEEQPAGHASELVNTGLYRFSPSFEPLFRREIGRGKMGITHVLNALIAEGHPVHAVAGRGLWADAVYPWDLIDLNAYLLAKTAPAAPPAKPASAAIESPVLVGSDVEIGAHTVVSASSSIGSNVTIGAGSVVDNCIVYDDAQIGAGSVLRNSIVGHGARIGARFTAIAGASTARTVDGFHDLKDFGCVVGEDALVGGGVTVAPGSLIGNRARVAHGRFLSGNVEEGSIVV